MISSKNSSQRQRDIELLRLKREELAKQHEADLRTARQHLEIEAQTQLQKMVIQHLEEEHRKHIAAAAAPKETELMTTAPADGSSKAKRASSLLKEVQSRSRNLFKIWSTRQRPGTWQMLQMKRVCTFLVPSLNPTKQFSHVLLQFNF